MLFLSSLSVYYKTEHMGVISVAIDSSVCMTSSHRKEDDDVVLVESELLNGMVWFFFCHHEGVEGNVKEVAIIT